MSIPFLGRITDKTLGTATKIFLILVVVFVLDVIASVVLKGIILGKATITVNDLMIPGLLTGVIRRLFNIFVGFVDWGFAFLKFLVNMTPFKLYPGVSFETVLVCFTSLVSNIIALIFVDFFEFLAKYLIQFNPLRVMDIIFTAVLKAIQDNFGFPVYDAYKGLMTLTSAVNAMIEEAVAAATKGLFGLDNIVDIPLNASMLIVGFFMGGLAYYPVDTAYAAFKDYGVTSGGVRYLKHPGGPKKSDYVQTRVVEGQIQYKYKSFVSEEKKSAWAKIWDGITKRPSWKETVSEEVWVVDKYTPEGEEIGHWETQSKTVDHPEAPYLAATEKTGIIQKLKKGVQSVYEFMKGYWEYDEPK